MWDHTIYPTGYFDLVAAGVPCTEYSQAKTKGERNLDLADRLVRRTVDVIKYFYPLLWWIGTFLLSVLPRLFMHSCYPYNLVFWG